MPQNAIKLSLMGQSTIAAALQHDEALSQEWNYGDFLDAMHGADVVMQVALELELKVDRAHENDAALGRLIRDHVKACRWKLAVDRAMAE